ncbi:BaiN/RdsA family NAD(P)/FAD-dependent oxidoreductase [Flavitalea flava]
MNNENKKLLVIGGGAAGLFCAVNAARLFPSMQVTILEKTGKLLSKVKVSGGGRCNVTHHCDDITEMAKKYPRGTHFVKKAFHRWFTTDTIKWFEERGVALKAEPDGRMFPVTDSSQTIIDCLMQEVNKLGIEIRMKTEVVSIEGTGSFRVLLSDGRDLSADYVCIACGGFPKVGLFEWIVRLGHSIEPPVPSLFTFNMPGHPITQLMGVSVPDAQVKISGSRLQERGPLLITHWGLSGPVVLRLSAWGARELAARNYEFNLTINWIPSFTEQTAREKLQEIRQEWAPQKIGNKNPFGLPQRLWEYLLAGAGAGKDLRWADLPAREQNKLVNQLCTAEFSVKGKTTFKEEFVTAGGVKLSEVDPSTMQSKKMPGLFFAGEILDVDGITGGFNFQHAWTSGWIAAHLGNLF